MREPATFIVAPFVRRRGQLQPREWIVCRDEGAAYRRGKAMMARTDGLVFFKIDTSEEGDVWSRVELLASVGDVPPEADDGT